MIPFRGVLISWLMLVKNSILTIFAASAASRALTKSVTSMKDSTPPLKVPDLSWMVPAFLITISSLSSFVRIVQCFLIIRCFSSALKRLKSVLHELSDKISLCLPITSSLLKPVDEQNSSFTLVMRPWASVVNIAVAAVSKIVCCTRLRSLNSSLALRLSVRISVYLSSKTLTLRFICIFCVSLRPCSSR